MSKRFFAALIACFLAIGAAVSSASAAPNFPPLGGRVTDTAHLLSAEGVAKLTALSAEHEKQTGNQVVIATVKSTDGADIESYANDLHRAWGLGQKGKDNGVLILVSLAPKAIRINVGYGLEGELTDAQSKLIIVNTIAPAFKAGDFDGGLYAAAVQVMRTLGGKPTGAAQSVPQIEDRPQGNDAGAIPIIVMIVLFMLFGRHLWPLLLLGGLGGLGGGRGDGFGGGGFGGGGFGGGGGSAGGGGASGSW
jgi:uncharacterized protein